MQVNVLELSEWRTPASDYHVNQAGDYRIGKYTYQRGYYAYHGMDGYALFHVRQPFKCTTLLQQRPQRLTWREWMVDSPTDYRAMQKYAVEAKGRVLTSGLGLGLVTHELLKQPAVDSITIVEISPNVIELVGGYLPEDPRIQIINQNFWEFIKDDSSHWNTIIVDVWVYYGTEQQVDIYKKEIIPASERLRIKYPNSQIFFHGFAGMPPVEQVDKALVAGDDVDALIYGLGRNGKEI